MTTDFPIPHYTPFAHDVPGAGLDKQYPVPLSSFSTLAYIGWNRGVTPTNPDEAWNGPADPGAELELTAELAACAQASRLNTAVSASCEGDILAAAGPVAYRVLQSHSVRVALAITMAGITQSRPAHMTRELQPPRPLPGQTDASSERDQQAAVLRSTGPEARAAASAGATNISSTTYADNALPWYVEAAQSAATATITGYTVYKATRNPYLAVAAGAGSILLDDETVAGITNLIAGPS